MNKIRITAFLALALFSIAALVMVQAGSILVEDVDDIVKQSSEGVQEIDNERIFHNSGNDRDGLNRELVSSNSASDFSDLVSDVSCTPHRDNAVGMPGVEVDGQVYTLEVFDDGTGDALYTGSRFLSIGGLASNSISRWKACEEQSSADYTTESEQKIYSL